LPLVTVVSCIYNAIATRSETAVRSTSVWFPWVKFAVVALLQRWFEDIVAAWSTVAAVDCPHHGHGVHSRALVGKSGVLSYIDRAIHVVYGSVAVHHERREKAATVPGTLSWQSGIAFTVRAALVFDLFSARYEKTEWACSWIHFLVVKQGPVRVLVLLDLAAVVVGLGRWQMRHWRRVEEDCEVGSVGALAGFQVSTMSTAVVTTVTSAVTISVVATR
jgi:hypothetical protein